MRKWHASHRYQQRVGSLLLAVRLISVRHSFVFVSAFVFLCYFMYSAPDSSGYVIDNRIPMDDLPAQCRPANKIAFMKTHKCASSTVENILFRHALRENLNVAVPLTGNYLSRTTLFNRSAISDTPWGHLGVDIFALHNRWNRDEVLALMLGCGQQQQQAVPASVSIVRDPVDQFESLYNYMKLNATYKMDLNGFVETLRSDPAYINQMPRGGLGRFGRNQIAFDWGVSPEMFDSVNRSVVAEMIRDFDGQFDLVMVAERMEESLVLLADLLCWPLEYVTHLDLNVRKPERVVRLGRDERETLANWLGFDSAIYRHFYSRFEQRVAESQEQLGSRRSMQDSLAVLSRLNGELRERCVVRRVGNELLSGKFLETHNDTMGYVIDPSKPDCDPYAMSEPAYLDSFRQKMLQRVQAAAVSKKTNNQQPAVPSS